MGQQKFFQQEKNSFFLVEKIDIKNKKVTYFDLYSKNPKILKDEFLCEFIVADMLDLLTEKGWGGKGDFGFCVVSNNFDLKDKGYNIGITGFVFRNGIYTGHFEKKGENLKQLIERISPDHKFEINKLMIPEKFEKIQSKEKTETTQPKL